MRSSLLSSLLLSLSLAMEESEIKENEVGLVHQSTKDYLLGTT